MSNKSAAEITDLAAEQRRVRRGMAAGALASAAALSLGTALLPGPADAAPAGRLAFAAGWLVPAALPLAGGIAWLAAYRFFHADAIDGASDLPDPRFRAGRAFLQNTLEQTALLALVLPGLALALPEGLLGLVPAAALWFVAARLAFRLGYAGGAGRRAFGFAATFYPTLLGLAAALLLPLVARLAAAVQG